MTKYILFIVLCFFFCTTLFAQGESKLDHELIAILDTIFDTDQNQLRKINRLYDEFGYDSERAKPEQKIFHQNHLINLEKIETILHERGWLGADVIGEEGNRTLFIIIQHSEIDVQLKYLPMMREASKKGNVVPRDLAHLEDRIASKTDQPQKYGTTIKRYQEEGIFDVWPILDPANVDERRASVGLGTIAEHIKNRFNLDWNLEEQIIRTIDFEESIANKKSEDQR